MSNKRTIDELEILTPDQLLVLLIYEINKDSPDVMYIQDLITCGCPINYGDYNSWTPLHHAAMRGQLEVVRFLISSGVNIQEETDLGSTAWGLAKTITREACPELRPKYD